jgi:hypothetical protein
MSIRHIVMWKLSASTNEEREQQYLEIKSALEGLNGVIPEIQSLTVSQNVHKIGDNYDVVLDSVFETIADVEAYAAHPAHVEAGTVPKSYAVARAQVDVEF